MENRNESQGKGNDLATWRCIGTLGHLKSFTYGGGAKTAARFTIKTEVGKNASTFSVVAWPPLADQVLELQDGQRVDACGALSKRSYERDGATVWETNLSASAVLALDEAEANIPG